MPNDPITNKPWIRTVTGKAFPPLDPIPELLDLADISHALGNVCRWTGHPREFYSVAEHCVRGSLAIRDAGGSIELQKAFLMHDATEAYIADLSNPLKLVMPDYRAIEERLMTAVVKRFQLVEDQATWECVKIWDLRMLATEARDLMGDPQGWPILEGVQRLEERIEPWTPFVAGQRFSNRAYLLGLR